MIKQNPSVNASERDFWWDVLRFGGGPAYSLFVNPKRSPR